MGLLGHITLILVAYIWWWWEKEWGGLQRGIKSSMCHCCQIHLFLPLPRPQFLPCPPPEKLHWPVHMVVSHCAGGFIVLACRIALGEPRRCLPSLSGWARGRGRKIEAARWRLDQLRVWYCWGQQGFPGFSLRLFSNPHPPALRPV